MKKIIVGISVLSLLFISCDKLQDDKMESATTITKGEERTDLKEDNMKEEGEKFLKEMESKEGVSKTASGLLYEVVVEGEGSSPLSSNSVKVNYTGMFLDGKVFDSTEGKKPIEFGLTQVISGWTEGLQLMNEGAKYKFYIPYQLAYGPQGYAGVIPPFSALIFEVELIDYK